MGSDGLSTGDPAEKVIPLYEKARLKEGWRGGRNQLGGGRAGSFSKEGTKVRISLIIGYSITTIVIVQMVTR